MDDFHAGLKRVCCREMDHGQFVVEVMSVGWSTADMAVAPVWDLFEFRAEFYEEMRPYVFRSCREMFVG